MICICLFLSVQAFALVLPHGSASDVKQITSGTGQPPCNDCPCDDEQGDRKCNSTCPYCTESAFLPKKEIFDSFLIKEKFTVTEPLLLMPQVYYQIFVPPQIRSLDIPRQYV